MALIITKSAEDVYGRKREVGREKQGINVGRMRVLPPPAHPDSFHLKNFAFSPIRLKPGEFVRRVGRVHLCDIPMLHDARPVQPIDIRQRDGAGVFRYAQMHEADVIVEIVAQELEIRIGDDAFELGGVGVAALLVEGVVLDQTFVDVVQECTRRVFVLVEFGHEGVEDGTLLGRCGGPRRAVGWRGRIGRVEEIGLILSWRRRCEEDGQAREEGKHCGELHFRSWLGIFGFELK